MVRVIRLLHCDCCIRESITIVREKGEGLAAVLVSLLNYLKIRHRKLFNGDLKQNHVSLFLNLRLIQVPIIRFQNRSDKQALAAVVIFSGVAQGSVKKMHLFLIRGVGVKTKILIVIRLDYDSIWLNFYLLATNLGCLISNLCLVV